MLLNLQTMPHGEWPGDEANIYTNQFAFTLLYEQGKHVATLSIHVLSELEYCSLLMSFYQDDGSEFGQYSICRRTNSASEIMLRILQCNLAIVPYSF